MKKTFAMTLFLLAAVGLSGCGNGVPLQPNELQTPQYNVSLIPPETDFTGITEEEIHVAGSIKVIGDTQKKTSSTSANFELTPETIWSEDNIVTYNAFTLPEKAAFSNEGNIGILTIPEIHLSVKVYEAPDEMEAMEMGAAHFKSTSAWDGNIGVSAHNINFDGSDGYFKNLNKLSVGDILSYETSLGTRNYSVTQVKTISADNWNYLSRSTENRLTLITCINGQPENRLLVQAEEKQ